MTRSSIPALPLSASDRSSGPPEDVVNLANEANGPAADRVKNSTVLRSLQLGMGWLPERKGGGLDRVYHSLIQNFPAVGIEVVGLVAGSADVFQTSGRQVRAFAASDAPILGRLRAVRRAVREALEQRPPAIVASHFALYTLPALDLLREWPLVVHFHGPWGLESRAEGESAFVVRAKAAIEHVVYRRAGKFIVLSEAFAAILRDAHGIEDRRIRIVPGGVDVERFGTGLSKRRAREALGWPLDRPLVLSVRRLRHRMGLENLVGTMQILRGRVPDALLLVAGAGPVAGELVARIASAGLEDNIRLLGFLPEHDLPLAYRAADLSVVPSVALEGFGLITLESLASGTPVFVTPIGGLPEVVRDLAPDLILPDSKPATIADRLSAALRGELRLPDAEACRRYACDRFAWHVIAQRTRRVYEEVLHG